MANPQIHAMLSEAVRLHQGGKLAEAAAIYQKVLALEPQNSDALYLLGMAALQNGQPQPGADLIRRAIAVNGRQPDYHFHLAIALTNLGQMDEAVASYRRALVLRPGDAGTLNNLGNVLAASGKYDEALTCLRRALDAEPGNWGAVNNMGTVLWSLDRKDEAEAQYRKALSLKPDYADAMINLGNALRDKGDVAGAAEYFRRAVAQEPASAAARNNLGQALWNLGQRDEAMACYRKAVALDPKLLAAQANLGIGLWESGELDEADKIYRGILKADASDPDLLNNFAALCIARGDAGAALEAIGRSMNIKETRRAKKLFVELAGNAGWGATNAEFRAAMARALTEPWGRPGKLGHAAASLIKLNPGIGPLVERANQAWPARLSFGELLGDAGFAPLAEDVLLPALLTSTPNTDMALERFLTMARAVMREGPADDAAIAFCAALALQCFINEYVFLPAPRELADATALRDSLNAALEQNDEIAPRDLLTMAAYFPLYGLGHAAKLLERSWPAPVEAVLTQQLREPLEEARLAREMPRLTKVDDDISLLVQNQYEENPYPRWVRMARRQPDTIMNFLSGKFPFAAFERQPGRVMKDILVAGCGTGQHSISSGLKFGSENMLAVDLSLASLSYAKRKSDELGLPITYGQADILELDTLDREFDLIESLGVLHHMKDPYAGWQALLRRLRPHGFMWLGFYSETARRNVVEARARIAQKNLGSSADEIRAFRQELADSPDAESFGSMLKSEDFFSVSAARDLMFHAQEHRLTISAIARFLKENNLIFLGFEMDDPVNAAYHRRFPEDPAATDLGNWDIFEMENPGMFAAMYVFWVQKP